MDTCLYRDWSASEIIQDPYQRSQPLGDSQTQILPELSFGRAYRYRPVVATEACPGVACTKRNRSAAVERMRGMTVAQPLWGNGTRQTGACRRFLHDAPDARIRSAVSPACGREARDPRPSLPCVARAVAFRATLAAGCSGSCRLSPDGDLASSLVVCRSCQRSPATSARRIPEAYSRNSSSQLRSSGSSDSMRCRSGFGQNTLGQPVADGRQAQHPSDVEGEDTRAGGRRRASF